MALNTDLLEPADFAAAQPDLSAAEPALALHPVDESLLRPDHPFLSYGQWRAFITQRHGKPVARVVASIDPRQTERGLPVGAIGFLSGTGDPDALAAALASAHRWLHTAGARVVRCPMRFSTWFGHRTVTEDSGTPTFLMEPAQTPHLNETLSCSGYRPAHRAVSLVVENDRVLAKGTRHLARFRAAGYRDRPLDRTRLPDELALLHRLASAVFADNWGFAEISAPEFGAYYAPLATHLDPDLVRFIERDNHPVAFIFAAPDVDANQFVFKTIGVLPEVRGQSPGIGAALVALTHQLAAERGFRRGVHALMTEGSLAHRTSSHWGAWLRSYATFERPLN